MSFISYAQNYEDITLHRALKAVQGGFYIDVGANDPIQHSVTQAFYERGWRGINIEPVDSFFRRLQEVRPQDCNLQILAGAKAGRSKFYEIVGSGISRIDRASAEKYAAESGLTEIVEREFPILTLNEICELSGAGEIHFLKVDVEGAEAAVLSGIDLRRFRPWVILVEATETNSTVSCHEEWEEIITGQDYVFVYFDGLNRFYVPREREAQLRTPLSTPPNVFDYFIRHDEHKAIQEAEAARRRVASLTEKLKLVTTELARVRQAGAAAEAAAPGGKTPSAAPVRSRTRLSGAPVSVTEEFDELMAEAERARLEAEGAPSASGTLSSPAA